MTLPSNHAALHRQIMYICLNLMIFNSVNSKWQIARFPQEVVNARQLLYH